jgi:energy-converting hydrogenase Eha subunit E
MVLSENIVISLVHVAIIFLSFDLLLNILLCIHIVLRISQKFLIKRTVKYILKSQRRQTFREGGSII